MSSRERHQSPSTGTLTDDELGRSGSSPMTSLAPSEVEVRRNAGLNGLVGVAASALAIAFLWRASQDGAVLDWVLCAVMAVVGVLQLVALVDARTPLLIADTLGVRIRLGREWRGLPWGALDQVVVEERDSWLRDGRLVLSPRNLGSALDGLEPRAARQVSALQRWYGAPLAVPLGLTTRTSADHLLEEVRALAADRTEVVALRGHELAHLDEVTAPEKAPSPARDLLWEDADVLEPGEAERVLIEDGELDGLDDADAQDVVLDDDAETETWLQRARRRQRAAADLRRQRRAEEIAARDAELARIDALDADLDGVFLSDAESSSPTDAGFEDASTLTGRLGREDLLGVDEEPSAEDDAPTDETGESDDAHEDHEDHEDHEPTSDRPEPGRRPSVIGGLATLVSRAAKGQSHDVDRPALEPAARAEPHQPGGHPGPRPGQGEPLAPAARHGASPLVPAQDTPRVGSPVSGLRQLDRAVRVDIVRDAPSSLGGQGGQGGQGVTASGNAAYALDAGEHDARGRRELPESAELRRQDVARIGFDEEPTGNVRPLLRVNDSVEPLVIDEFRTEPALDPVIGPEVAAARTRARLSVDDLSDRTRIRPHVLEAIEVDDFTPCGGDFYARGHLRTLARVLGLDAEQMLRDFDERYAHAPINARRVFEAELATGIGGGLRATASGPRWSLLVGAVLALLVVWGAAHFFNDTPEELTSPAPGIGAAATGDQVRTPVTPPGTRPMTVTASRGPAQVVVRDRTGRIVWSGHLETGEHHRLRGVGPFSVTASDAGAVDVTVAGKPMGSVGLAGTADTGTFG